MTAAKPDDATANEVAATEATEQELDVPEWYPYRDWSVIPDPLVWEQETREAAEAYIAKIEPERDAALARAAAAEARNRELEAEIARLRG